MRLFEFEAPLDGANADVDALYLTLRNFAARGKNKLPFNALSTPDREMDYYTFDSIFKKNEPKFKTVVNNYNENGILLNQGIKPATPSADASSFI